MMSVRSTILAAAVAAATMLQLGVAAGPAAAQTADSIIVSYADLNLAGRAGRDALDRRIANAATQLCGAYSPTQLGWAAAVQACQAETIALTQPQRDAAVSLRGTVRISSASNTLSVSRAAI
jgi:UrcA family protein